MSLAIDSVFLIMGRIILAWEAILAFYSPFRLSLKDAT